MSDMKRNGWPPIIANANRPAWVIWRGYAITVFMWCLFFFILGKEIELARQSLLMLAGLPVEPFDSDFKRFLVEMRPTRRITVLLVAVLAVATLASRLRRIAALRRPQPAPAHDRELARDLGLDEAQLNDLRQQKIVVLDVDEKGRVTVQRNGKSFSARVDD